MAQVNRTPADEFRSIPTEWIWIAVLALILILGAGATPWDAISALIAHEGVDEEGAQLIGFVAGYTFPLALGVGIIAYLNLTNQWPKMSTPASWLLVAAILIGAAMVSDVLGLGQLPASAAAASPIRLGSGPWFLYPALIIINTYANAYGWPIAICGAAVGVAAALHLERLQHGETA